MGRSLSQCMQSISERFQFCDASLDICSLLIQQGGHVGARGYPLITERDHLAQLPEREPDGLTGSYERDPAEHILAIVTLLEGGSEASRLRRWAAVTAQRNVQLG